MDYFQLACEITNAHAKRLRECKHEGAIVERTDLHVTTARICQECGADILEEKQDDIPVV